MSTEILTTKEAAYLRERIKCDRDTCRAAVALEAGNVSLYWALNKSAQVARNAFGFFGSTLTKERKAELTKMAALAASL